MPLARPVIRGIFKAWSPMSDGARDPTERAGIAGGCLATTTPRPESAVRCQPSALLHCGYGLRCLVSHLHSLRDLGVLDQCADRLCSRAAGAGGGRGYRRSGHPPAQTTRRAWLKPRRQIAAHGAVARRAAMICAVRNAGEPVQFRLRCMVRRSGGKRGQSSSRLWHRIRARRGRVEVS